MNALRMASLARLISSSVMGCLARLSISSSMAWIDSIVLWLLVPSQIAQCRDGRNCVPMPPPTW